jgi:hypothetical protein
MKYVSINGHKIRSNSKHGFRDPPIRIAKSRSDSKPVYASAVEIIGSSKLIYNPDEPIMKCGARMVLVCDDVKVIRN